MKTIQAILTVALLSMSVFALGEENIRNGNYWRAMDDTQKLIFLAGVIDGTGLGINLTAIGCFKENPNGKFEDNLDAHTCSYGAQVNYRQGSDRYLQKVSTNQIKDGLSEFYSDYKNRGIRVNQATFIILRQIAGDANLDTLINNSRASAAAE